MLAKRSINKEVKDKVFVTASEAKKAIEKYGKDSVINATIGSLHDENDNLVVLNSVMEGYRSLAPEDIMGYAQGITGSEEYKECVKRVVLGFDYKEKFKDNYMEVIATAGGSGAISNSLKNYLNIGEKVLLPNFMWEPYKMMAKEIGGEFETYILFDEEGKFNLYDFKEKVYKLIEEQESLVIIINDPCQNPTGYKLTLEEWREILNILSEASKIKNIILLNDIAYLDFDIRSSEEKEEYRKLFLDLPKNLLVIFLFSLSKSFTGYGLRVGAQLAISKNQEVIDQFREACSYSCRATWSNISRGGMKIFSDIVLDEKRYKDLLIERQKYVDLLAERAKIFLEEAKEIDLKTFNYKSGFFITIPVEKDMEKVIKKLKEQKIYVVEFVGALRIAICSIPKRKVYGLAEKIKQAME